MKKISIIFLIFTIIFCCGFKKHQKPYIILSLGQINPKAIERVERFFPAKQRIYYALMAPEGFKFSGIRIQLSKQDDKTSNWGFSIIKTEDIYVEKGDYEYKGYIYTPGPGHYILQFFYLNNKRYPIIHREFVVQ